MYGDSQKALNDYYHSIYLGRELLVRIGYNTFLAKSVSKGNKECCYFIIQRKGGRDIITKYSCKDLAYTRFTELLYSNC